MRKRSKNRTVEAKLQAREFRKNMSLSEKVLWAALRKGLLGFRFRRQVPIGPYFLDFYCPAAGVCVEVDGEQHDRQRDTVRDIYLAEQDILVVRIPSLDLFGYDSVKFETWLRRVKNVCEARVERK